MNINWQTFLNPLKKFSERQLLLFGIISTMIGCWIGFMSKVTFDGLIDAHPYSKQTLTVVCIENIINITLCCILLLIIGKSINRKTRLIDILNTTMLSRIPLYAVAVVMSIPIISTLNDKIF